MTKVPTRHRCWICEGRGHRHVFEEGHNTMKTRPCTACAGRGWRTY